MSADFSEPILLICSGLILSSFVILFHLIASINPYHKFSIPVFAMIVCGVVSLYSVSVLTGEPIFHSLRSSLSSSIEAILNLLRAIMALTTIGLIRITLLTNRPVAPSS